jgi:hypothetical protein
MLSLYIYVCVSVWVGGWNCTVGLLPHAPLLKHIAILLSIYVDMMTKKTSKINTNTPKTQPKLYGTQLWNAKLLYFPFVQTTMRFCVYNWFKKSLWSLAGSVQIENLRQIVNISQGRIISIVYEISTSGIFFLTIWIFSLDLQREY